jgi:peptidoglycan/LPS O-acetylase OafA/YrhL
MENKSLNRQSEIDGIRGWASLCVLFFHLVWEIFGVIHPQLRSPSLYPLLDGPMAVLVFFVLSGDALSVGFITRPAQGINPRMVMKRYFRLIGPIFLSCFVVYVLMRSGLTFNHQAAPVVQRQDWLGIFLSFDPSVLHLLRYSLSDVFTAGPNETAYNPFLWPMGIELIGSAFIFCVAIVYPKLRHPARIMAGVALFLLALNNFMALFALGMWFGILRRHGVFARLQSRLLPNRIVTLAALAALFMLDRHPEFSLFHHQWGRMLFAAIAVFVFYASADLIILMRSRLSSFVGKISFPIYFMQFPVIVSWTSWCLVQASQSTGSLFASPAVVVASSAVLVIIVATVVEFVEARYLRWIDNIILRNIFTPIVNVDKAHENTGRNSSIQADSDIRAG